MKLTAAHVALALSMASQVAKAVPIPPSDLYTSDLTTSFRPSSSSSEHDLLKGTHRFGADSLGPPQRRPGDAGSRPQSAGGPSRLDLMVERGNHDPSLNTNFRPSPLDNEHDLLKGTHRFGADSLGPQRRPGSTIRPQAASAPAMASFRPEPYVMMERGNDAHAHEDQIPIVLIGQRDSTAPPDVFIIGQRDGTGQSSDGQPDLYLIGQRGEPPILIIGQRDEAKAKAAAASGQPYIIIGKRDDVSHELVLPGARRGQQPQEVPVLIIGQRDGGLTPELTFEEERGEMPVLIVGEGTPPPGFKHSSRAISEQAAEHAAPASIFLLDARSSSHSPNLEQRAFKMPEKWKGRIKTVLQETGLRIADSAGMSFVATELNKLHDKEGEKAKAQGSITAGPPTSSVKPGRRAPEGGGDASPGAGPSTSTATTSTTTKISPLDADPHRPPAYDDNAHKPSTTTATETAATPSKTETAATPAKAGPSGSTPAVPPTSTATTPPTHTAATPASTTPPATTSTTTPATTSTSTTDPASSAKKGGGYVMLGKAVWGGAKAFAKGMLGGATNRVVSWVSGHRRSDDYDYAHAFAAAHRRRGLLEEIGVRDEGYGKAEARGNAPPSSDDIYIVPLNGRDEETIHQTQDERDEIDDATADLLGRAFLSDLSDLASSLTSRDSHNPPHPPTSDSQILGIIPLVARELEALEARSTDGGIEKRGLFRALGLAARMIQSLIPRPRIPRSNGEPGVAPVGSIGQLLESVVSTVEKSDPAQLESLIKQLEKKGEMTPQDAAELRALFKEIHEGQHKNVGGGHGKRLLKDEDGDTIEARFLLDLLEQGGAMIQGGFENLVGHPSEDAAKEKEKAEAEAQAQAQAQAQGQAKPQRRSSSSSQANDDDLINLRGFLQALEGVEQDAEHFAEGFLGQSRRQENVNARDPEDIFRKVFGPGLFPPDGSRRRSEQAEVREQLALALRDLDLDLDAKSLSQLETRLNLGGLGALGGAGGALGGLKGALGKVGGAATKYGGALGLGLTALSILKRAEEEAGGAGIEM